MNPEIPQRVLMATVVLAVLVLPSSVVWAATTGQLSGFVVDEDGNPLPGVSVSASSPAQIGGLQATETDLQGFFQYPRLNPGYFTVRLELDGFLTQELTEVQVRLGRMTQVQVTLPPATFGEAVTVVETTPVVDPQRVSTGQTFTSEFIEEAAIGNMVRWAYTQIVLQAAGTTSTWRGGESGGGLQVSVLGSTGRENVYLVDGLDTTDPYLGIAQVPIPVDSIQEVAFESAGFGADLGRATGGVINALTKSGSNVHSGSFDARFGNNNLEESGDNHDPDEQASEFQMLSATLGGRFVRDRAWFFGSLESQVFEWTSPEAPTTDRQTFDRGFFKVTGQASPRWLALGKFHMNQDDAFNLLSNRFTAPEAVARASWDTSILQAETSGILSQDLLWELQIGTQTVEENWGPMIGDSSIIQHWNLETGQRTENYIQLIGRDKSRDQFGTNLTWFIDHTLGSHEIKLGADYQQTGFVQDSCWTGFAGGGPCRAGEEGFQFLDLTDAEGNNIPYLLDSQVAAGPFEVTGKLPSVSVNDSWRMRPGVTLQLGLRWDRSIYDNDVGETVADLDLLQPRLGATWDITRNSRNLLRASWGRFMSSSFLQLPRLSTTVFEPWSRWVSCSVLGTSGRESCFDAVRYYFAIEPGGFRSDPEGWDPVGWALIASGNTEPSQIAPNLEPHYSDTFIIGFERELFRRTSLELSYVDKKTRNVLEDTCVENFPTPTPGTECSAFIIANLPQARRDYAAWILNFQSRRWNRLQLLASYTNSETKGSTESTVAAVEFDVYPYHFDNTYGYLDYHRQHALKTSGYVSLPLDFGIGFSGIWASPFRWTPRERAALVAPGVWGDVLIEPRGSQEGDEWSQLDMQFTKGFVIGRVHIRLIASVLNLFSSENVTAVCERVSGCGEFEMGEALGWQQPRRYELGVRVEF